jgi:hypothetical protein
MKNKNKMVRLPKMTEGEKMIWAAVYAVEYNRLTAPLADKSGPFPWKDPKTLRAELELTVKAAQTGTIVAALAVVAARASLRVPRLNAPAVLDSFAKQMISSPKSKQHLRASLEHRKRS